MEETFVGSSSLNNERDVVADYGNENSYYKIDNWYEDIKEYTFRTKTIPLLYPEAMVIKKLSERITQILLLNDLQSKIRRHGSWDDRNYEAASAEAVNCLTEEDKQHLKDLEQRIDEAGKEYVEASGFFFVKLSTRSPKDSVFSLPSIKQMIRDEIAKSNFQGDSPEASAEDIKIFVRAMGKCLSVNTGSQAIDLLVRSKRVMSDITFADLGSSKENHMPLSIVLREWNPNINPEWEFRVFIFNNKLTTATQYTDILYIPEMAAKKEEIKKFIQAYWDKVKGNIKCDTYTMDLAIDPSLEHACIVELNDPPPTAGLSLFNWDNPKDKAQIQTGEEFELRIAESLAPGVRDTIHQPLRKLMDECRGIPIVNLEMSYKHISCSCCHRYPISKTYYRCDDCEDYDVCLDCRQAGAHSKQKTHKLIKIGEDGKVIEVIAASGGWNCILL